MPDQDIGYPECQNKILTLWSVLWYEDDKVASGYGSSF